MNGDRFLIVSSPSAWFEPTVMVHSVGCGCRSVPEAQANPGEWTVVEVFGRAAARIRSEFRGETIGASVVAWMDCTL